MSDDTKSSGLTNYYSGGFAEIVSSPSMLTFSFFKEWFTGKGSLGKAMEILRLPYEKVDVNPLIMLDNEMLVDLKLEEKILYKDTIFTYAKQNDEHSSPVLKISLIKLFNPRCVLNTIKILLTQSRWIAKPDESIKLAETLLNGISEEVNEIKIEDLDKEFKDKIWPSVIAIGLLSEFYNQLLIKEAGKDFDLVNNYLSLKIAKNDWFFASITDQFNVKDEKLSFNDFIEKYGVRSDKDYELLSPRWHEMQQELKKRIEDLSKKSEVLETVSLNKKYLKITETYIRLQLLRSLVKRKALIYFDKLRQEILKITKDEEILNNITKQDLLNKRFYNPEIKKQIKNNNNSSFTAKTSGKGITVFAGKVEGIVKNINSNNAEVPEGTIGIFPNASPEFAIQYPKSKGMIFLKGGQTSHGAIVAREFKIPAIIDSGAVGVKDGTKMILDSQSGEWKTS